MTATQIRPAGRLSPLVAGIRTAVESHADWAETAQLVADQLSRHLLDRDANETHSPDDQRSNSHVTRPRPQLRHLTRRLRHR